MDTGAPLLPSRLFSEGVTPFVERARAGRQNFSLLELGSVHGLYTLALARQFRSATLLALEPNRTVRRWFDHSDVPSADGGHVLTSKRGYFPPVVSAGVEGALRPRIRRAHAAAARRGEFSLGGGM